MGHKFVIGPIDKGLRLDRTAFVIDNDSFPTLQNAYQWRGRVKRKRGTILLTRLQRYSAIGSGNNNNNLLNNIFATQPNAQVVPGSVSVTGAGGTTWTDVTAGQITYGVLNQPSLASPASINYATGIITNGGVGPNPPDTGYFNYYPQLPVMGLEDFITLGAAFPATIGFDTKYSYNIPTSSVPSISYDVSYFLNPSPSSLYPDYIAKSTWTTLNWNGTDYQQFFTSNFLDAMWTTNGIAVPFSTSNIGMQFNPIINVTINSGGPPAKATLEITNHGLVVGDFLFLNEINGITGINFQTCYVISVINSNNVEVEFPIAVLTGSYTSNGIAQYLTNNSNPGMDCIRWYNGDPTDGTSYPPVNIKDHGWVNFAPPLSEAPYSIANNPARQYYLVGARMVIPYKDRLLFIGPVIQSSSTGIQYLQDTIIYSQNGTPYYTCSFTGSPTSAKTNFSPMLLPSLNQTASAAAFFGDSTGFGGWVQVGIDEAINTASLNEDVLILGMDRHQVRMVYTGNDILPFNFFIINSEFGSTATFSVINMDHGVLTYGSRGYTITSQVETQRFDLPIPDLIFDVNTLNAGNFRVCAIRDFENEWVHFTYPDVQWGYNYPTTTLQYNYRDATWAQFFEMYTTYGLFRQSSSFTWANMTMPWASYNDPWYWSSIISGKPKIIGGNTQGFVLIKDQQTAEDISLSITSISGTMITSPNHCLNNNDFILIENCVGTVGQYLNGQTFQVSNASQNSFIINAPVVTGTYLGNGVIIRQYVPFIQTKQFPTAWDMGRKTRIGPQMYLFTKTDNAQIQLLIYLSQQASSYAYNEGQIVPQSFPDNSSLIYSTVLYTCPESTNLGLTPANINLQMVTANNQQQIWHRMNTSLIGDTVQIGFIVSNEQMMQIDYYGNPFSITGVVANTYPTVLTCSSNFEPGDLIQINGVLGITQLNYDSSLLNNYQVISVTSTTVTINVDSTNFGTFISPTPPAPYGTAIEVVYTNQFQEIEFHSAILDVSPSQMLS